MHETRRYDRLDLFRIAAAALVVAIHTSPFGSFHSGLDFFFTRVLARIAVPFFFMVAGQFVISDLLFGTSREPGSRQQSRKISRYVAKIGRLYAVAILIYLPIGYYAGQYQELSLLGVLRMLVFDGTFYHLWYFPACIMGVLLVYAFSRILRPGQVLALSAVLYMIGLFGDSYYGIIEDVPVISDFYEACFQVFSYTRNGIFLAPIFLVLGAVVGRNGKPPRRSLLWGGFAMTFLAMTEEAFILRHFKLQRHDSMYIALVPVMVCLYGLLLFDGTEDDEAGDRIKINKKISGMIRKMSAWIYILHPAVIVLVRGGAKVFGLTRLFVENSFVHYLAVLAGSAVAAGFFVLLMGRLEDRRAEQRRYLDGSRR